MAEPALTKATLADLQALPDHVVGELLGGELIVSPRPSLPHATATSSLGFGLGPPFQWGRGGPGGWWILDEPELHLGGDVLVPDMAGWRRERVPALPDAAAMSLAPDWVCEALSPSTRRTDRLLKMPTYARAEVPWLWLLDAEARTLEVFALRTGKWVLQGVHGGAEPVRAQPFEAVALELSLIWGSEPE